MHVLRVHICQMYERNLYHELILKIFTKDNPILIPLARFPSIFAIAIAHRSSIAISGHLKWRKINMKMTNRLLSFLNVDHHDSHCNFIQHIIDQYNLSISDFLWTIICICTVFSSTSNIIFEFAIIIEQLFA